MGPVTISTAALVHRLMLEFRILDGIIELGTLLLVAVGTELAALLMELEAGLGAVGIMTFITILLHRVMDMPHGELLLAILMALKTDLSLFR